MKKRNSLLFLSASLAWAVYLSLTQPWRGDAHARTTAQVGLLYPNLHQQLDQVAKVVIQDQTHKTTLRLIRSKERIGRGWMVEEKNYPANFSRLTQLLENLASIKTSDVVSINPDKHDTYGVGEGQGTRVQVYSADNRLLVDWIAGSLRHQDIAGGQKPVLEFYMRDARSDRVYLSGDAIQPAVDPVRWCEVHLLKDITADRIQWVQRIDFQNGESWRIERRATLQPDIEGTPSPWFMTEPKSAPVLLYAGDSMATTILNLEVADILGEANPGGGDEVRYGFPQDRFRVGIDDAEFLFELGKPAAPGQRYFRVKDLPYIFSLRDFDVSQLRQPIANMLEEQG